MVPTFTVENVKLEAALYTLFELTVTVGVIVPVA